MFINIEVERLRRYMSKAEMAGRLAVPVDILNDWIFGRRAIPASKLRALSQLFDGCSIDYLLRSRNAGA
ncbi:MAG: helix-turn-helix transcriptional regulator [Defluviitaleaceae bacterium]|nr:helix-turn-helix transcriptional regulator [Defluviitaleaceae bacterium]MCL2217783.1 helix-turn-helix transcriptional regulator [Defluviitaleaceae bacterium]